MAEKVWVKVCPVSDLPNGKAINILVNGQRFVVARCDDQAYMVQGYCTHMLYPLKDAKVEGCIITCPLHGSKFDLRDGSVQNWPMPMLEDIKQKKMLRTFETQVKDGIMYVAWVADDPSKVRVRL